MTEIKQKSQSKKIRDILFRLWEQDSEGLTSEEYYQKKTDEYINELMKKFDDIPSPEYE